MGNGQQGQIFIAEPTRSLPLQFWSSYWFSNATVLQRPEVKGSVGVHGLWTVIIHREYSGHFLLLMMVVFGTIIDESPKKANLYFPTKKCPISKKLTIRKAMWHFPHQAHAVRWIKMWSIACEEETLTVCVEIASRVLFWQPSLQPWLWIYESSVCVLSL